MSYVKDMVDKKSIRYIENYVSSLSEPTKNYFDKLFEVIPVTGSVELTPEMGPWVKKTFGDPSRVEEQHIIRIRNRLTEDTALFNDVRSSRPLESTSTVAIEDVVKTARDPFQEPFTNTPLDEQGRITGEYTTTSANVAKYDGHHSLIIFDEPNPYNISRPACVESIQTAFEWFDRVGEGHPFLMWNCLWKSGASVVHTHMQMTMAKRKPYRYVRSVKKANEEAVSSIDTEYLDAWRVVHRSLGLSKTCEFGEVFCSLTPVKEKELVCFPADTSPETIGSLLHQVKETYLSIGVQSFNMALYVSEEGVPSHLRFVDRGKLDKKTTDFGGVEVFAGEKVIGSDPYKVIRSLNL